MYPVLLKIGKLSLYTYGFFVAAGFVVGITIIRHEAKRLGEDQDKIMDLCFYVLIAAIVGSRLFYVLTNLSMFISDPLEVFRIWNGGLVFYGGFVVALITAIIYVKQKEISLFKTADMMAPALAMGHAIGRVGCFFAGCCYGKASDLPWAVTFTNPDSLAPVNMPLHPTQLYSFLTNLTIFIFLWMFRGRKRFDGQIFWVYVLLYGVTRFFIEVFRGDFRGDLVFGILSISQAIGGGMVLISVVMFILLGKRESKVADRANSTFPK
jgi:phosphatidylglycerol:prolipoprotein diacylglycerol transferase